MIAINLLDSRGTNVVFTPINNGFCNLEIEDVINTNRSYSDYVIAECTQLTNDIYELHSSSYKPTFCEYWLKKTATSEGVKLIRNS